MYDAMKNIFENLPPKFRKLSEKLDADQFAELMRRLMSLRLRNRKLPERIYINSSKRKIVINNGMIKLADSLLTIMFEYFRKYGVQPDIIAQKIREEKAK